MRATRAFVDTGAWVGLALTRDPHHERAVATYADLLRSGVRLTTSIPVVLETTTFLERAVSREVAIRWKDSLDKVSRLQIAECKAVDMERAWAFFERRDLHKLSAVDATSFAIMQRLKLRSAFTFDSHFAAVGFQVIG